MQTGSTTLQDLFDLYKKKLLEQIDAVSIFDDASEYEEAFRDIEMKVKAMSSLIQIRSDLNIDNSSYTPMPQVETPIILDDIEETPANTYLFERKLRGGVVHIAPGEEYFIPEQMVRHMNVVHHDELEIIREYDHHGSKRYVFRIANRVGKLPDNRIELNEFVVLQSEENNSLFLYHDINGEVMMRNHLFYISHNDIENYSLTKGDIVDAAYYSGNPEGISVIYKHKGKKSTRLSLPPLVSAPLPGNVFFLRGTARDASPEEDMLRMLVDEHFVGDFMVSYGIEMIETLLHQIKKSHVIVINHSEIGGRVANQLIDFLQKRNQNYTILNKNPRNLEETLLSLYEESNRKQAHT